MPPPIRPLGIKLAAGVFLLALAFNIWGVSVGWTHVNLPGYEFRQTQTAISALFIQRTHDFSPAYPTPVLGKPWSIPMEFPLYQWCVVLVGDATGLPLVQAGRWVGALCFYLSLPALAGLLARLRVPPPHRLVVLSLVLTSPLYIFYTRAILIESMALMCGLWYLHALAESLERRSVPWLAVAALAGTAAGLAKVTTFMIFVLPAFFWCLWQLWRARPRTGGPAGGLPLFRTFAWLAAVHAAPFAATLWWLRFSDQIKQLNPSGEALSSARMTGFNFGTGRRFDPEVWSGFWRQITENIVSPWTLALALGAFLLTRRWTWQIALCLALFLVTQTTFPVLYSVHGYYYYAAGFLLLLAVGLAVSALLEFPRIPRWAAVAFWIGLCALQGERYLHRQFPSQYAPGNGGGLAAALAELSEPDDCVIIAGDDWSSIIPYYAQRRALMIRNDLTADARYLETAFNLMQGERIAALVLIDHEQGNTALLERALRSFDLDPRPVFTWRHENRSATVYVDRQLRPYTLAIFGRRGFHEVAVVPGQAADNPLLGRVVPYAALLPRFQDSFRIIHPRPVRFFSTFGPELWHKDQPGRESFAALPDTKLWFTLAPGRHRVRTSLEIVPESWQGVPEADASDGVELVVAAAYRDGRREVLQSRYFNPRLNPADRDRQPVDWTVELPADAELELSVNGGPAGSGARDWVSLGPISLE